MRIEKLENGYKLTDLYIAAAILCNPIMELVGVENDKDKRQVMFIIKGDCAVIKGVVDSFYNGRCSVDASLYKSKVLNLKSIIHSS